jgi:GH15 family glucan-1,4-alpha-glucosidase
VFGEVASTLARMPEAEDDIRVSATEVQIALANHLCDVWRLPDEGIWEVRGGAKHFVHSKVMAWVALDRAIQFVECKSREERDAGTRREWARDVRRWKKVRAEIHREVCEQGFNRKLNSFVQYYGAKTLDASCLRIALVGFLPATDPRILGTVEAIEQRLMRNGFVQRYKTRETDDGLADGEGQFLACSFWMVANLWLIGRKDDARAMFERLLALRNDVGLLSEEYNSDARRLVGNFPQALSHIALVHAAFAISGAWTPQHSDAGTAATGPRKRKPATAAKGTTKGSSKRS